MIYELFYNDYSLDMFPTEGEASHRATYLPKGRYLVRQWMQNGDFIYYDPTTNRSYNTNSA